jgi:hypothetical protein
LSNKDFASVLKSFRDAASDSIVASEAFVSFAEEHKLFLAKPEDLPTQVSAIKRSSYQHHITRARDKKVKAIVTNPEFAHIRGALDEHRDKLSGLTDLSQQVSGDSAKSAISKFIRKYNRSLGHVKFWYWTESVILNAIGAGVGLIALSLVATYLASHGFMGLEIKVVGPTVLESSASTIVTTPSN